MENQNKSRKGLWIAIGIIVALAIIGILIWKLIVAPS